MKDWELEVDSGKSHRPAAWYLRLSTLSFDLSLGARFEHCLDSEEIQPCLVQIS